MPAPLPSADSNSFLRSDGTWSAPAIRLDSPGMFYTPPEYVPPTITITQDPLARSLRVQATVTVPMEDMVSLGNFPDVQLETYLRRALREFARQSTPPAPEPAPLPVAPALGRRKGRSLTL